MDHSKISVDYHSSESLDTYLCQGDILYLSETSSPCYQTWYVVLTADCDLMHEKTGGIITCIKIISEEQYLNTFFAPMEINNRRKAVFNDLASKIQLLSTKKNPDLSAPTESEISDWLADKGVDGLCADLSIEDQDKSKISNQFDILATIDSHARASSDPMQCLEKLWKIENKSQSKIVNTLSNALKKQIGIDHMFIPTLHGDPGFESPRSDRRLIIVRNLVNEYKNFIQSRSTGTGSKII